MTHSVKDGLAWTCFLRSHVFAPLLQSGHKVSVDFANPSQVVLATRRHQHDHIHR